MSEAVLAEKVIATASSKTRPLPGQDHRSGPNFCVMENCATIRLSCSASGAVFDIKEDIPVAIDPTPISGATNNSVISGSKLSTGKNYYIANPKNATDDFFVVIYSAS